MNIHKNISCRPGVALLVVLIIVMTITITALGFLSQSDVELACGANMLMRTQMDYLAESGLEHARGLILNPQDVNDPTYGYWRGGTGLKLVPAGNDCYDVAVIRDANDRCNYTIDCNSYRLDGAEKVGRSSLRAELRLDPCIAYWAGSNTTVWPQMTIKGDVYCGSMLTNNSTLGIDGDVFAAGTISGTGTITGRKNESVATAYPVAWPNLAVGEFEPTYYIGSTLYSAEPNVPTAPFSPSAGNPAGVRYCIGDADIAGGVTISGTLVVTGKLTVSGANTITAVKNFPALLVGGQVLMKNGGSLVINGLAQIEQEITVDPNTTNANIDVTGGLFIHNGGVTSPSIVVNVTADPAIASIEIWPGGTSKRWGPAAGAFFRSIERVK